MYIKINSCWPTCRQHTCGQVCGHTIGHLQWYMLPEGNTHSVSSLNTVKCKRLGTSYDTGMIKTHRQKFYTTVRSRSALAFFMKLNIKGSFQIQW